MEIVVLSRTAWVWIPALSCTSEMTLVKLGEVFFVCLFSITKSCLIMIKTLYSGKWLQPASHEQSWGRIETEKPFRGWADTAGSGQAEAPGSVQKAVSVRSSGRGHRRWPGHYIRVLEGSNLKRGQTERGSWEFRATIGRYHRRNKSNPSQSILRSQHRSPAGGDPRRPSGSCDRWKGPARRRSSPTRSPRCHSASCSGQIQTVPLRNKSLSVSIHPHSPQGSHLEAWSLIQNTRNRGANRGGPRHA